MMYQAWYFSRCELLCCTKSRCEIIILAVSLSNWNIGICMSLNAFDLWNSLDCFWKISPPPLPLTRQSSIWIYPAGPLNFCQTCSVSVTFSPNSAWIMNLLCRRTYCWQSKYEVKWCNIGPYAHFRGDWSFIKEKSDAVCEINNHPGLKIYQI